LIVCDERKTRAQAANETLKQENTTLRTEISRLEQFEQVVETLRTDNERLQVFEREIAVLRAENQLLGGSGPQTSTSGREGAGGREAATLRAEHQQLLDSSLARESELQERLAEAQQVGGPRVVLPLSRRCIQVKMFLATPPPRRLGTNLRTRTIAHEPAHPLVNLQTRA
jgi:hypothetical protein